MSTFFCVLLSNKPETKSACEASVKTLFVDNCKLPECLL